MNDFAFKQDAPGYRCSVDSRRVTGGELGIFTREPVARFEVVSFAHRSTYHYYVGLAEARCRPNKRVQDGLQIERRAANDLEHVGGGSLLLQGFAQFVEETGVLDGDGRLVGEGGDQLDLLVGERPHLGTRQPKSPNWNAVPQHRNAEIGAKAPKSLRFGPVILGISLHIGNMNNLPFK